MVRRRLRRTAGGAAALFMVACGEMEEQVRPEAGEPLAAAAAPIPAGTLPRGGLEREDRIAAPPGPVDLATLRRGRDGFEMFCSPCHGRTGYGDGMVPRHGFPPPPSFHSDRLQAITPEHIVQVITNGFGVMYPYADRVEPEERWAIAAYVKALQLSQRAPVADLPDEDRARLAAPEG